MKYRTIVADPPWPYRTTESGRFAVPKPAEEIERGHIGVEDMEYGLMSIKSLKALSVGTIAEPHAHLYLWTTNAFMVEAHEIARAWGFEPKTILTWGKVHQDDPTKPSMKVGYWFRSTTEHVVFAVRGSLRLTGTWPTLMLWPRIGAHSVKPEAFIDMVEQASPGPYLEMFSRRHRLGWDVWGNESANTATLDVPA